MSIRTRSGGAVASSEQLSPRKGLIPRQLESQLESLRSFAFD